MVTATRPARHSIVALAVIVVVAAASAWFYGAGTAIAPEPARLNSNLNSTTPTAAGYYVTSFEPATVVKWSSSWTPGTVAFGTPCSPADLYAGQDAIRVIYASGSYRKCM